MHECGYLARTSCLKSACMPAILGIDVGGTSTDAVLLSAGGVRAKAKVATTEDVYSGIKMAICQVADQHGPGARFPRLPV